ncbi:MAG: hypothetical protein JWN14_3841 [Chthonomonadales bacterium]|nr:hypothetical protein [Chthonomonadales bacterium]
MGFLTRLYILPEVLIRQPLQHAPMHIFCLRLSYATFDIPPTHHGCQDQRTSHNPSHIIGIAPPSEMIYVLHGSRNLVHHRSDGGSVQPCP